MEEETFRQSRALAWITQSLKKNKLPYQIVGGLAAITHGGSRPLHDIDLYVPFDEPNWTDFFEFVQPYVTWGPEAVVEGSWDLFYVKINYHGQKIEIGDSNHVKIQNCATGKWITQQIDFGSSVSKVIFDCKIDVMPKDQLIAYKKLLGRAVDLQDIHDLARDYES